MKFGFVLLIVTIMIKCVSVAEAQPLKTQLRRQVNLKVCVSGHICTNNAQVRLPVLGQQLSYVISQGRRERTSPLELLRGVHFPETPPVLKPRTIGFLPPLREKKPVGPVLVVRSSQSFAVGSAKIIRENEQQVARLKLNDATVFIPGEEFQGRVQEKLLTIQPTVARQTFLLTTEAEQSSATIPEVQ